jgi:opacity protein-like surface antigen
MPACRLRRRLLAIALIAFLCTPCIAAADGSPFDAPRVVLGAGAGAMHVDLPDPDAGGESFGTRPRVQFALGYEARPWLELGAELGFTYLPESDSLNAVLVAQGSQEKALRTHLQAFADARLRWLHGGSSWAPFARAGVGVASLRTSAGDIADERETDPAWNAGGGLDWFVHRHILVRLEGLYIGQTVDHGGTRSHAAAGLTVHYALHAGQLGMDH